MKIVDRFTSLATWIKIIVYVVGVILVVLLVNAAAHGIKNAFFGDPEVKRANGNTVVAQEQGRAATETGIEATNTVVKTYDHYVTVDHTVKGGQDAVNRADKGQQMDPDIDAAVASGLCQLHDDLCRR